MKARKLRLRISPNQIDWLENSGSLSGIMVQTPSKRACGRVISWNIVKTLTVFVLAVLGAHGPFCSQDKPISFLSGKHSKYSSWNKNAKDYFCRLLWSRFWTTPWNRKPRFLLNLYRMEIDNILYKTTATISAFKSASRWMVSFTCFLPE